MEGLGLLIFLVPFLIWLGFLLSLNKLTNVIRTDGVPQTYVSKIWVWAQVIPFVGFIALIVYNIKLDTAARALEAKLSLPFKTLKYPATLGWIVILGILYTWIPVVGVLALVICMILFWINVSSTSRQIEVLKLSSK